MRRLLILFGTLSLLLIAVFAPAFTVSACATDVLGSGNLSGDVTVGPVSLPAGAELVINISTESGCHSSSGTVKINADGSQVYSKSYNIWDSAAWHGSHVLGDDAENVTVTIDTDDVYGTVSYSIIAYYDGSSAPALPPDHRINWRLGDNVAAVYQEMDAEGNPELHIYGIGDEGEGDLWLKISQAELQVFNDNPPASNTLIKSNAGVAVYALSTPGEFQISLGPDAEGKIYDLIFNGLPVENLRMIYWSIYGETGV